MKVRSTIFSLVFFILGALSADAQSFEMTISTDSIKEGNIIYLTYKAENLDGDFRGPDLSEFQVVSGPNTKSLMTKKNGKITQFSEYSYNILMDKIGDYVIEPAYFKTGEEDFETEAVNVTVLPNPEGIIEQAPAQSQGFRSGFPSQPTPPKTPAKKNKRKIKKI